jgi:DNA topoisomerase-1
LITGTVLAFRILKEAGYCETEAETKRQIVAALDKVSESLGNTRTVCKKYYVHPQILSLYQDKKLEKYCPDNSVISKELDGLFPEEISVMKILAQ